MAVKLASGFELLRFSDTRYRLITVEIQYEGKQVAQLNADQGLENIQVELLTGVSERESIPKFALKDFLDALSEARQILAGV